MILLLSVANTLLPAAALVFGVWLAMRWLPRLNAATRFAVWWVVLAIVATMPLVPRWMEGSVSPGEASIVSITPAPAVAAKVDGAVHTVPAISAELEADWEWWVAGVYAAVLFLLLARLAVDFVRLRRLLRRAEPLLLPGAPEKVRVLASRDIETPVAAGFLRPAVIFPVALAHQLTNEECHHILAHEAAHIARGDHWTNLLGRVAQALLWPHPLVAVILWRIEVERELACDDWAVTSTGPAASYARSLARLVELAVETRERPLALAAGVVGKGPRASQRVALLLDKTRNFAPRVSFVKFGMSLLCLAVLVTICAQSPMLVAVSSASEPRRSGTSDSLLTALSETGYNDLPVEQIIELKNNGIGARYLREIHKSGWGKLATADLVALRSHGVSGDFLAQMRAAGIPDLTLEQVLRLHSHGVRANTIREIHALGFGPYAASDVLELAVHGLRAEFFRGLKQGGIGQISAKQAIEGNAEGLTSRAIGEARRYGPNLSFEQLMQLKRAGVI